MQETHGNAPGNFRHLSIIHKEGKIIKLFRKLTAFVSAAAVALTCVNVGGIGGLTAAAETVGDFTVTGGTSGTDYTYENNVLTIKTDTPITLSGETTTDTIVVEKDTDANITLDGVNIDVSGTGDAENGTAGSAAFTIADNSTGNVTITLADGSVNTLKSGYECAGLQKNGEYSATLGKLTINGGTKGTGKLTATGGASGAGIGGGDDGGSGSNITISGGTVTATGGFDGAGIGGGYYGSGSNITISGGTVTATGGDYGAGIGGVSGSGSGITISGGTVTANSGDYGAGIGGGVEASGSYITISGGTVTATGGENGAGIGGGDDGGSGSSITISGGSVKAVAGTEANAIGGGMNGGGAVTPTNGTDNVYLLTIANPTGADVFIDNSTTPYKPSNHSAADENDTNLYVYLTGTDHTVTVGTGETAVTTEYKFYTDKFLPVPTVSDFTFTAPENLKYTGTAKAATVTSDKSGMGEITPKYYNASGAEVTQGADFVPGTYTMKIDAAKGDNYAEATDVTSDDWKFTITAGDLTASGSGVASGTYGDKLSELTVSGLTANLGTTEVEGDWSLSGDDIPNVGDTAKYIATFTPDVNQTYYNPLTAEVSLAIAKANAPTIEDIPVSYGWATTGEKTPTVAGLPTDMGTLGTPTAEISDENGVLTADSASYSNGKVSFKLNSNTEEMSATQRQSRLLSPRRTTRILHLTLSFR